MVLSVVAELRSRFDVYMKTGDDSKITIDLQESIYSQAVKWGGREEWETVRQIVRTSKNPSAVGSAITAMCSTRDPALMEETFNHILTETKDQDMFYFFVGLSANPATRRFLGKSFKKHYPTVSLVFIVTVIANSWILSSCRGLREITV